MRRFIIQAIMELTTITLLGHMQRGRDYTPTHLAQQFGAPPTVIRDMLYTLAEEGKVIISSRSPRMMQFRRADARVRESGVSESSDVEQPAATSVATFPVTRTFHGSLADYENSLAKHRSLAMLSRRS
jgi:hypothetical protein